MFKKELCKYYILLTKYFNVKMDKCDEWIKKLLKKKP